MRKKVFASYVTYWVTVYTYVQFTQGTYGDNKGNVDPAGLAPLLVVDDVAALWRHLDAQLVPLTTAAANAAVVVEDAAVVEGRVPARLAIAGGIVGEAATHLQIRRLIR